MLSALATLPLAISFLVVTWGAILVCRDHWKGRDTNVDAFIPPACLGLLSWALFCLSLSPTVNLVAGATAA